MQIRIPDIIKRGIYHIMSTQEEQAILRMRDVCQTYSNTYCINNLCANEGLKRCTRC